MKKLSSKFPGKRVLVVEDYFINQELIQGILKMMDCDVDVAINGFDAVKIFKNKHFDLILMDIHLPIKDGYQTTGEIRQLGEKGKNVAIVAVTANAMRGDKEKCLDAGMDDYISKPIDFDLLEEILHKFLK